ncbi:Ig-like domain-containing protein [Streptomyces sp. NPDC058545]|uniref:Ig-like domain-containing protein n=1 Tax=Streptomyces sp. NPDC058545 TaxID=3346544 RepID=UPI0036692AB9
MGDIEMNNRLARLRSPVALLTCCAMLFAALAAVLAFTSKAQAAEYVRLGTFSLEPATGSITSDVIASSATTDGPCPAGTSTNANTTTVRLLDPANPNGSDKNLANGFKSTLDMTGGAFTLPLISTAFPPIIGATSLQKALRGYKPDGSLDGDYTLVLKCSLAGPGPAQLFFRKIHVTGDTWAQIDQQATTLALSANPTTVSINQDFKLTATVSPAAAGSVEFSDTDTSGETPVKRVLGTAPVTDGKAELTVTAPATGGGHKYDAAFTPTDSDAFGDAQGSTTVGVLYVVTAKDADGNTLGDNPTLFIGQKVKVTARGFKPGATVAVNVTEGNVLGEVTANADGAIVDYAFTVPDALTNDEHHLQFRQQPNNGAHADFAFTSTDEDPSASPSPTEPADLDVTDEDGSTLEANPNLEPGQTVKITARGYGDGAKVKVTLADSEATFDDATANADGTVENYAFTVPEEIEDGDHALTLAEDKTDGHSVDFAFTTGDVPSESPEPSPSDSSGETGGDSAGADTGGTDTGGLSGGSGGGSGGGSMAATGAEVGAIGLSALALVCAGSALVIRMRRKGLLTFGGDSLQH